MKNNYRLPKEFAEKWLKELRSGDYTQGVEALYCKEEDSYCCIGTAGVVAGINKRSMDIKGLFDIEDFAKSTLNKYKKLGLPENLITYHNKLLTCRLADMNDSGMSFEEIANWIE